MTSQTQGIQQLLAAEKKAAEKVAEARKRKARRLKQAKDEAAEEIEKYRLERENQLKKSDQKDDCKGNVSVRIDNETAMKIKEMDEAIAKNRDQVINEILSYVYNIKPELHRNYHKKL